MEHVFSPRIFRSPCAEPIWKDTTGADVSGSLKSHPVEFLRKISDEGFDGISVNALFRTLVPSNLYPDVKGRRLDILKRLVDRAGRFGIKVYLILHEPRSPREDDPFWKKNHAVRGQPFSLEYLTGRAEDRHPGLCASTSAVRDYLEQSSCRLFHRVSGLGGALVITASESHTHCYSHFPIPQRSFAEPDMQIWSKAPFLCPRCKTRSPVDVVAEIISLINRGMKSAAPDALLMVHTWSWFILEPDPQKELISRLPKGAIVFSDWERGGKKAAGGRPRPVDEYSYSYDGPSSRFRSHCRLAAAGKLGMMAKISINGTHEMRAVPYLPLPYLLARKMRRMKHLGVGGYEGFLPFGGESTPMTRLAGIMSRYPQPSSKQAVRLLAENEYGKDRAGQICAAWRKFSAAWRHYPFSTPLLYWGPMNYAAAYPFEMPPQRVGRIGSWVPLPRRRDGCLELGDNLESWVQSLGARAIVSGFRRLLIEWADGMTILGPAALEDNDPALRKEWGIARHIQLSLRSTVNIIEFLQLNRRMSGNPAGMEHHCARVLAIAEQELSTAKEERNLIAADPRLGYHPEAHARLFLPGDLDYKMRTCASLIRQLTKRPPLAAGLSARRERRKSM